ncbi:hypothetical protein F511_21635 [Dorcoceras hygrometricum]|uniref:Uncharacterized protein n=1 Tax=Dorcoceras hygrometricum TaxID=472368 RepID=A0A2Z7AA71_9LAMI|nr:hypothetical protein F511_21635 [Dorcoceras hygrometricum]
MAPSVPRTRAAAALRMKQIALDNQGRTIRRLRAQLATERRGLATLKKELEDTQVALEASHKVIAGLTEIGLSCITDSACKNQLVVVSVHYDPFNPYSPIRSTIIGKSRVAKDPIAMRTSWRSNSDIASVTSIGYPRMSASGESSTTMHRLLHVSGSHPIPPPDDPKKSHSPKSSSHAQHIEPSITDSACKNQLVVVSVQYGPFNPYSPIRSTTIGKSRVAKDPIAMRTSWRSNSDIASVTSIRYPRMSASGESSTTMHRLLHASGSHPIPPPDDPK